MRRYRNVRFAQPFDKNAFERDSYWVYKQLYDLRKGLDKLVKYYDYFNDKAIAREYGNLFEALQIATLKAEGIADLFQGRAKRLMYKDGLLK